MCYHKRIHFVSCGHFTWGREVRACPLQIAFDSAQWPMACDTMIGHALHTVKVYRLCPDCQASRSRLDDSRERLRQAILDLKLVLGKVKGNSPASTSESVVSSLVSMPSTDRKSKERCSTCSCISTCSWKDGCRLPYCYRLEWRKYNLWMMQTRVENEIIMDGVM